MFNLKCMFATEVGTCENQGEVGERAAITKI